MVRSGMAVKSNIRAGCAKLGEKHKAHGNDRRTRRNAQAGESSDTQLEGSCAQLAKQAGKGAHAGQTSGDNNDRMGVWERGLGERTGKKSGRMKKRL